MIWVFHGQCQMSKHKHTSFFLKCFHHHVQIIMLHKRNRLFYLNCNNCLPFNVLTLRLNRIGSMFSNLLFFKQPHTEIITCRVSACLFKWGNQERTERVTLCQERLTYFGSKGPVVGRVDKKNSTPVKVLLLHNYIDSSRGISTHKNKKEWRVSCKRKYLSGNVNRH